MEFTSAAEAVAPPTREHAMLEGLLAPGLLLKRQAFYADQGIVAR
jgi:hypothetical protein